MALLLNKNNSTTTVSVTLSEVSDLSGSLSLVVTNNKGTSATHALTTDISGVPDRVNKYVLTHSGFISSWPAGVYSFKILLTVGSSSTVIETGVLKIIE